MSTTIDPSRINQEQWLKRYYFMRAAFSIVWVGLAFAVGTKAPGVATLLLVVYPAWDAIANWLDASPARIRAMSIPKTRRPTSPPG